MAVIIGAFTPLLILTIIIIVHELGHFLTALFLKINVDKIYIYPFGGISKLNIELNESILKEFLVLIMGPIFQIIISIILKQIDYFYNYKDLIDVYNNTILVFNLLPIYPLDGGKLLNLILSLNLSFKKSFEFTIYISYIVIILIFIFYVCDNFTLNLIIIISFLIYKVSMELKKKKFLYDKFLLERYLNNYHYKKRKNIDNINQFMRGKNHLIKKNNKYHTEKEVLRDKFGYKY